MNQTRSYERARVRATAKYQFFVHAIVYGAVIGFLVLINLITWSGAFWAVWPMLGWGLAVVLHAARVFLMADQDAIIDALTEDELRSSGADDHGKEA